MKFLGTLMKLLGTLLGYLLVAIIVGLAIAGAFLLIVALAALPAALLWAAWIFSGEALTGVHIGFVEMWASVVFIAEARSIILHGVVSKELAARASNKAPKM